MSHSEAERLFVILGNTLQDMDISNYDKTGDDSPQPVS